MAEDEDEDAADDFEAVPAGEVAEISPEDEAAGQAAIDDVLIYGNNRMIARGQVIVVGENIAVSITDTVLITDT